MEQQNSPQEPGLFGLTVDTTGRAHLAEAARWARFLAIVGFIVVGLLALAAIFGGNYVATMFGRTNQYNELGQDFTTGMTIGLVVYYLCVALLVFFAYLFLYRFAVNTRKALREDNQDALNRSFQNLKILYRYCGILTVIGVSLLAIFVLFAIIGRTTM